MKLQWVALAGILCIGLKAAQAQEPKWSPPKFEDLPASREMPDLMRFADGRRVTDLEDWELRREEMKAVLLYYQYGRMPAAPERVSAQMESRKRHSSDKGTDERWTLRIESNGRPSLKMRFALYVPEGDGPFPVVIREEGTLGRTKQIGMFLERGYMFVEYARHDLDPDRKDTVGAAQAAYPEYDWATLAVWAWGGMRMVDWLESRDDVDGKMIAITGHSRGGKMALLAGAMDERFALVVPNGSGAGGAGSYRHLGPGAESGGMNDKPHWYHERMQRFAEKEERLPFDQHFLKALVAPRALLCTESTDDLFANPWGTYVTSREAGKAWRLYDKSGEENALVYRRGEHDSSTEDWQRLLEYAEWQFFGREPTDKRKFFGSPSKQFMWVKSRANGRVEAALASMQWVRIEHAGNQADADFFGAGTFGAVGATV